MLTFAEFKVEARKELVQYLKRNYPGFWRQAHKEMLREKRLLEKIVSQGRGRHRNHIARFVDAVWTSIKDIDWRHYKDADACLDVIANKLGARETAKIFGCTTAILAPKLAQEHVRYICKRIFERVRDTYVVENLFPGKGISAKSLDFANPFGMKTISMAQQCFLLQTERVGREVYYAVMPPLDSLIEVSLRQAVSDNFSDCLCHDDVDSMLKDVAGQFGMKGMIALLDNVIDELIKEP